MRDLVAGRKGVGAVMERWRGVQVAQRAVRASVVVVGQETVDTVLQVGDGGRCGFQP